MARSKFYFQLKKVDGVFVSAYLVSLNGSCSERVNKSRLYTFLLRTFRCFGLYARSPRHYTFGELCEFLLTMSKALCLSFDVVVEDKYINSCF